MRTMRKNNQFFAVVNKWEILWEKDFIQWGERLERGEISAGRFKEEVGMDYLSAWKKWYRLFLGCYRSRTKGMYAGGMISKEEYRAIKEVLGGE